MRPVRWATTGRVQHRRRRPMSRATWPAPKPSASAASKARPTRPAPGAGDSASASPARQPGGQPAARPAARNRAPHRRPKPPAAIAASGRAPSSTASHRDQRGRSASAAETKEFAKPPGPALSLPIMSENHETRPALRALAHRHAAYRRRAHRAVQLALCPPHRRHVPAAHRGHRPRALHPRSGGRDPERHDAGWA